MYAKIGCIIIGFILAILFICGCNFLRRRFCKITGIDGPSEESSGRTESNNNQLTDFERESATIIAEQDAAIRGAKLTTQEARDTLKKMEDILAKYDPNNN